MKLAKIAGLIAGTAFAVGFTVTAQATPMSFSRDAAMSAPSDAPVVIVKHKTKHTKPKSQKS